MIGAFRLQGGDGKPTVTLNKQGTLVATSSGMGSGIALAIKPGGSGDVTDSQRLWRLERARSGIGSGVIHGGYFDAITAMLAT